MVLTETFLRDLGEILTVVEFEFLSLRTAFLTSFVLSLSSRSALSTSIIFFCDLVIGTNLLRESGCSTSYNKFTTPSSCSNLSISLTDFFVLLGGVEFDPLSGVVLVGEAVLGVEIFFTTKFKFLINP